jgi:DNA-binding CsgD family transcriptional regulator
MPRRKASEAERLKLHPREIQILALCASGLTNADIGRVLFISGETVKSHIKHILEKLDVRSTTAAVSVCYHSGAFEKLDAVPAAIALQVGRRSLDGDLLGEVRELAVKFRREPLQYEESASRRAGWYANRVA